MPMKFVTRSFRGNAYYHIYNQGISGEKIFSRREDYEMFLYYLFVYTTPLLEVLQKYPDLPERLRKKNVSAEIKVLCYCLMPDHFHLVVKQTTPKALPRLMKQLTNAYTTYVQSKYSQAGGVMQGRYRAALIESEFLVLQMVRFVHFNPVVAGFSTDPRSYVWSSINSSNLLGTPGEWEEFHLDKAGYESGKDKIKGLTID